MIRQVREKRHRRQGNSVVGSLDNSAKQGIDYLLVGCGSALIELGLFQVLYGLVGLNVSIANIVAVACATAFNFLTNQRVTFKSALNPVQSLALQHHVHNVRHHVSCFPRP